MRLILTRHGETLGNKNHILEGRTPGRLSPRGLRQARLLALRLQNEHIDAIFSSDLKRAVDTTREVAKYHPGIPVHYARLLRESNLGGFEGRPESMIDWTKYERYTDVESREVIKKRADAFLAKICRTYPHETVLVVGHNAINKALTASMLKESASYTKQVARQLNASVSIYELKDGRRARVLLTNCTKHLIDS